MAVRPIFIPKSNGVIGVEEKMLEFRWHSGMAKSQKQKSVQELHKTAIICGFSPILEISSKSQEKIGINLSAFNLCMTMKSEHLTLTVETAFQSSKVFERGGPYKDIIGMDSRSAKKDIRLKESGNLIAFEFFGKRFPITPRTFFYDWIYINALHQNSDLAEKITVYSAFSDIEFNPARSLNCQAYSAALYVSLFNNRLLNNALLSSESFLEITEGQYKSQRRNIFVQGTLI
jgi:hypothetical protein